MAKLKQVAQLPLRWSINVGNVEAARCADTAPSKSASTVMGPTAASKATTAALVEPADAATPMPAGQPVEPAAPAVDPAEPAAKPPEPEETTEQAVSAATTPAAASQQQQYANYYQAHESCNHSSSAVDK